MREDVVRHDEVAAVPVADQLLGGLAPEEANDGRNALLLGDDRDVLRGLYPEHRHAELLEPLEQVAVVRGDLDDAAASVDVEALDHPLHVALRVGDPAVRVGREVDVLLEDVLGRGELAELDEEALAADVRM